MLLARELQGGFVLKSRAVPGNECITISVVYIYAMLEQYVMSILLSENLRVSAHMRGVHLHSLLSCFLFSLFFSKSRGTSILLIFILISRPNPLQLAIMRGRGRATWL